MATNKLKGLRAECNKNQPYFASLLDISVKSFGAKENGDSQFKEQEINLILLEFRKLLGRKIKYEDVFLDRKYTPPELKEG